MHRLETIDTGSPTMTTRDQYVAAMKAQLDEINEQIDQVAERSEEAKKDMKARYKLQMQSLRHESKEARAKLTKLRASSEEGWDSSVAEMERISAALKHSFNYLKSQL